MPSKSQLLADHATTSSLLNYAHATHGVDSVLHFIKKELTGQIRVSIKLNADPEDKMEGIGVDKREALADAVSSRFPA